MNFLTNTCKLRLKWLKIYSYDISIIYTKTFLEVIPMAVKVAINGFGHIGRLAFRQMFGAEKDMRS